MTHTILEHVGRTPLVELRRLGAGLRVPVLVKCEHMNPGGSVKDRIAVAIVADAEARGQLSPGMTLIGRPRATRVWASRSWRPRAATRWCA